MIKIQVAKEKLEKGLVTEGPNEVDAPTIIELLHGPISMIWGTPLGRVAPKSFSEWMKWLLAQLNLKMKVS
jgi:hypothetical protein